MDYMRFAVISGIHHPIIKSDTIVGRRGPFYDQGMEIAKEKGCSATEQKPFWKNSRASGPFDFESESIGVDVLILHEDLPTGVRAHEALANLEKQIEIKVRFLLSLCRFGMLEYSELAETALDQARRADMVFLSLHGDRDLPPVVRDWLLSWLETRDAKPCALVVSLDVTARENIKTNSTLNFLRVITAPLEVDLFLHLGSTPFSRMDKTMLFNRHVPVGESWIEFLETGRSV